MGLGGDRVRVADLAREREVRDRRAGRAREGQRRGACCWPSARPPGRSARSSCRRSSCPRRRPATSARLPGAVGVDLAGGGAGVDVVGAGLGGGGRGERRTSASGEGAGVDDIGVLIRYPVSAPGVAQLACARTASRAVDARWRAARGPARPRAPGRRRAAGPRPRAPRGGRCARCPAGSAAISSASSSAACDARSSATR